MASHPQPEKYGPGQYTNKVFQYDAREKLAIDDVDAKCDAIVTAATEGCKNINDAIKNVQIGQETLSVADSSLEPALEEVGDYINSIATEGIQKNLEPVKEQAASAFAKLQEEENARAKADYEAAEAAAKAAAEKNGVNPTSSSE